MTLNLKTEIEKINQEIHNFMGCNNFGLTWGLNNEYPLIDFYCGKEVKGEYHYCFKCFKKLKELQSKKQGLIQGAKMMIEEIKKISEEYFNEEYYHDFPKEPFETLKQLNNWLEKE